MKINIKDFCLAEGKKVKLDKWPAFYHSKKKYKELLEE